MHMNYKSRYLGSQITTDGKGLKDTKRRIAQEKLLCWENEGVECRKKSFKKYCFIRMRIYASMCYIVENC